MGKMCTFAPKLLTKLRKDEKNFTPRDVSLPVPYSKC